MNSDESGSRFDPVHELAEEYLRRRRRGECPSAAEYAARHPEHAGPILELFPALELLEGLKLMPEDLAGLADASGDGGAGPGTGGGRVRRLGDYTLLRELGRGGMGIVYEAEHESLKTHMALKVMHPRFRADRDYVRRFQTEARSAAKLHHTNIVPVFDYGEQDGVCYYAMQYIEGAGLERVLEDVRRLRAADHCEAGAGTDGAGQGPPIDAGTDPLTAISRGLLTGRFADATTGSLVAAPEATVIGAIDGAAACARAGAAGSGVGPSGDGANSDGLSFAGQPVSVYLREVTRLGAQVADALDYAHRQGVVHRDIKPSNLLLDTRGNVWVTDFGLAKVVEGDELSHSHDLVGTLRFMAPERFRGVTDPTGDIYSLGATLYELLTMKPAFAERDQARLIDRIAHETPAPLRQHDRRIPRDLETLVLKALAKDPKDRFVTAAALGDELRRYLESRPIRSRPAGLFERFGRWCRRNPGLAAASIIAVSLLAIVAIGSTLAAWRFHLDGLRIQAGESATRSSLFDSRMNLFDSLVAQAQARRSSRRAGQRFASLDALDRATVIARELNLPPDRFDRLRDEAIACMALPDLRETGRVIYRPPGVKEVAFDPAMTRYALRFHDGTIRVRRVADDAEIDRFGVRGDRDVFVLRFSPDGRYLATTHIPGFALTVRDINRGTVALDAPGPVAGSAARFSPDGRRIALCRRDGTTLIYDLASGRLGGSWAGPASGPDLAFRADGTRIATLHNEPARFTCRIMESEAGRLVGSIKLPSGGESVAWSPDGTTLATACGDSKIHFWDAATGRPRSVLEGAAHAGLYDAEFHPSGALLASNGWENRLRLWDPILGRPVLSLTADMSSARPEFSRDGRIVVAHEDALTTYEVDPALEYRTLAHPSGDTADLRGPSIRNDGRVLAVSTDGGLTLWDLASGAELASLRIGDTQYAVFESSGDLLTVSRNDSGIHRWPIRLDTDRGEIRIGPPRRLPLLANVGQIAQDGSGRTVAVVRVDSALISTLGGRITRSTGRVHVVGGDSAWISKAERTIPVEPLGDCRSVALSPDGQWLATSSFVRGVQVWRIREVVADKVAELPVDYSTGVAFSPDGRWLMTNASPCRLWEPATGRPLRQIGGVGLCFSPDGRLLAVQDADKVLRLVEPETSHTVARLESPDSCSVVSAVFSPDGSRLVVTTPEGPAVHIWDLRAIRKRLAALRLDWDAPPYAAADPADPSAPPLPPLQVDPDPLDGHMEPGGQPPEERVALQTQRIGRDPEDAESYHQRGHALVQLQRFPEALEDFNRAIRLRPVDMHLRVLRAAIEQASSRFESAIADLEAALAKEPNQPAVQDLLALCCNKRAWELTTGPQPTRDAGRALTLARRAMELAPDEPHYMNTLGVAEYRVGRFDEAIVTLERSLAAGGAESDAFDLFFLAMAHQRLAHRDEARDCFDRAVRWVAAQKTLSAGYAAELARFRAEAEAVLAGPTGELPDDVFAPAPPGK